MNRPTILPTKKTSRVREQRIEQEIVVDAYSPEERAMGWYYYLEDKITFPFQAKCVLRRSMSPLKSGEVVEVLSLAKDRDCGVEILVLVKFEKRKFAVPLAQLAPLRVDLDTRTAVADWQYWVAQGYQF